MIRRPPRSTQSRSSAASDVYKRQGHDGAQRCGVSAGLFASAGCDRGRQADRDLVNQLASIGGGCLAGCPLPGGTISTTAHQSMVRPSVKAHSALVRHSRLVMRAWPRWTYQPFLTHETCLLYTSDAADDLLC